MAFAPVFFGLTGGEQGTPVLGDKIVGRSAVGETTSRVIETDDFTSLTISIVFESYQGGQDVAVIADGDITKTTTSIAFNIPAAVAARTQFLRVSIRSNTTQLVRGTWWVRKAALED